MVWGGVEHASTRLSTTSLRARTCTNTPDDGWLTCEGDIRARDCVIAEEVRSRTSSQRAPPSASDRRIAIGGFADRRCVLKGRIAPGLFIRTVHTCLGAMQYPRPEVCNVQGFPCLSYADVNPTSFVLRKHWFSHHSFGDTRPILTWQGLTSKSPRNQT